MTVSPVIEFVDVHAWQGSVRVLRGVSFVAGRGAITALVGPPGGGKSCCLRQVIGLDAPGTGDVIVDGRSVPSLKKRGLAKLRRRFGVMFQGGATGDYALFAGMDIFDNVAVPMRIARHAREAEIHRRTLERLEEVGLMDYAHARPDELSGPLRKRAALARALAARPEIALLDDLDPEAKDLCEIIRARRDADGGTYLVTTRDADLAGRVADAVIVIARGRVSD